MKQTVFINGVLWYDINIYVLIMSVMQQVPDKESEIDTVETRVRENMEE